MWVSYIFFIIILAAFLLTLFASYTDMRSFRIPNWVSLAILALYPIAIFVSPNDIDWLDGLMIGGIVFVVGFGLFAMGLFGGGDVKLLVALGVWSGTDLIFTFLSAVALAGGFLVIYVLIKETRKMPNSVGQFPRKLKAVLRARTPVPYGVAIGLGSTVIFYHYAAQVTLFG